MAPIVYLEKICRTASEEVVLQLVKSKCMPVLLYGLEALSLYNQLRSLGFVINRFCMKLFRTTHMQVVVECQAYFGYFYLPCVQLAKRTTKFLDRCNRCTSFTS